MRRLGLWGLIASAAMAMAMPAAAELPQVQPQPPPGQKARLIGDEVAVARVGKALQPIVEVGKEMPHGLDKGAAGDHGRPALRRWCWLCVRMRARLS